MYASELREKLQALRSEAITIAGKCMEEKGKEIAQLVVDQQYDKGISGTGQPLAPYSAAYQKSKRKVYRGFTDYHLTGETQAEMTLTVQGEQYTIESTKQVPGYKLSDLLKRRDANSFELTAENKKVAWQIIAPVFREKMEERI